MRLANSFLPWWVVTLLLLGIRCAAEDQLHRRQNGGNSNFPTLGSQNTQSSSITATAVSGSSNTQSGQTAANTNTASVTASASGTAASSPSSNSTSVTTSVSSSASTVSTNTPLPTAGTNTTSSVTNDTETVLPLQPRITPALSLGGVVLIVTGVVYAIIGVKNRWIHIFLSTAYLTSLSITVLIVYVMNPPVSNAIQGAYFVGIFMTGIIFGAGALIFKEVTEGLGCMLGGFCLSMWFLTLKPGGLITSTGGKAIFISAFCVLSWSLSFSHYTRAYGLIGSISFSGATAFVLGIDCFSRGGLKEFWLYVWDLNDNVFPLNTNTYPITRGTRVETIVIILGCIVGVISQIKLWKIVKDRQKQKTAVQEEDERRKEAVEAALGRHLERQNDRDRSQWEKQYGDRLTAKRETVLWTDAHGEKRYSRIGETEMDPNHKSASSESLEMKSMARNSRSMYVARVKRQSVPVSSIMEVDEAGLSHKTRERQRVLEKLESNGSPKIGAELQSVSSHDATVEPDNETTLVSTENTIENASRDESPAPSHRKSLMTNSVCESEEKENPNADRYLSAPKEQKSKTRRSFVSFLSRSTKGGDDNRDMSQSQEALVVPKSPLHHSRASSLAATLDFENEKLEFPAIDIELANTYETPDIMVTPVDTHDRSNALARFSVQDVPISEPELPEEEFDEDPEAVVRPVVETGPSTEEQRRMSHGPVSPSKRQSSAEADSKSVHEVTGRSRSNTNGTTHSELTKGALEAMPSHLSHVVMSYRTNEWAKHIAEADEPLCEEPAPIEGEEAEIPTHLADPISAAASKRSSLNQTLPPEIPPPVPSAVPSLSQGIRINPVIQPEQPVYSPVIKSVPPSRTQSAADAARLSYGRRSTSTPMLTKQAVQSPPLSQNAGFDNVPRLNKKRSTSSRSLNQPTETQHMPGRRSARSSWGSDTGIVPPLPPSQLSNYQPNGTYQTGPYQHNSYSSASFQAIPARSETRLQSYDSHQPTQRNISLENQRREAMLTDWRNSQLKSPDQLQTNPTEKHRQQMLMERHQRKIVEEQEKNHKWQQELAVDARMRSRDMQELHREAMRKMQAGVNKKMSAT